MTTPGNNNDDTEMAAPTPAVAPASNNANDAADSAGLDDAAIWGDDDIMTDEIKNMSVQDLDMRRRMIENEIRVFKSETSRMQHDMSSMREKIKDNVEKIKLNRQLPHLVGNVAELLDLEEDEDEKEERAMDTERKDRPKGKSMVLKTTTRQTIYLPVIGLVAEEELKPGELVGVNKDSYLVLDKLPPEYDSRVKAMEIDEKPTDTYNDIGGCDKQIQELIEAIVLPMTHAERFETIGIQPPKGVLIHGPPGTGKTLLARACAAACNCTFLKLAGPQLVQMFIGDGAKIVRDAFELAREKPPCIIFIDELDAIGTKRSGGGELSGVREVQRTMLELLNQLDGFSGNNQVKVICATNRPDSLDPALLRSGRLDRKIELPHPNEDARARIMKIHSRKMNYNKEDVNFLELARCTDDMNGAQLKAVCVEAGMEALRRGATELQHEDYVKGIAEVLAKKRSTFFYFT